MRVNFSSVFMINDKHYLPIYITKFYSITITPSDTFLPGVIFKGLDIAKLIGHDLEIEQYSNHVEIHGVY